MPICSPVLVGFQANVPAWEADRPLAVEKCLVCRTCYPERHLAQADIHEGVCRVCRERG